MLHRSGSFLSGRQHFFVIFTMSFTIQNHKCMCTCFCNSFHHGIIKGGIVLFCDMPCPFLTDEIYLTKRRTDQLITYAYEI